VYFENVCYWSEIVDSRTNIFVCYYWELNLVSAPAMLSSASY
jgi:hypothetical protein